MGCARFRLRGLDNVNIEALLVATRQKLKRWLQTTNSEKPVRGPAGCLVLPQSSG